MDTALSPAVRLFFALGVALSTIVVTWFTLFATEHLNKLRDAILTGVKGELRLELAHRAMILANDWLPSYVGTGIAMLTFALGLLAIPFLFWNRDILIICTLGSILPLLSAASALVFTYSEYATMRDHLNRLRQSSEQSQANGRS